MMQFYSGPLMHLLSGLDMSTAVVADNRSLANDETGTVVDKHAAPDRNGRMDVDGKDLGHATL